MRASRVVFRSACAAVVIVAGAGCRGDLDPLERLPRASLERGTAPGLAATTAAEAPDRTREDAALPEGAGVEAYVRVALERNPALRAARLRVERLEARIPQVTSLEDPMVEVAPVGEMAQTAAGEVSLMTGVSQRFPFPGTLRARGRVAAADVAQALQAVEEERLRVEADVRRAYWSYWYAHRAIETLERSVGLLSQFRQVAESQYRAGAATQQDVLRASTELAGVRAEIATTRQRAVSAGALLNQLMNRPPGAALPEPDDAAPQDHAVRLERLLSAAAAGNPSLARLRERIEQFRLEGELAQRERLPDFAVGVQYNAVDDDGLAVMANGDDQWWLSFGFTVPLWADKYDAAEREAAIGVAETSAALAAEHDRVAFRVQDALASVEAQRELLELFRGSILPQARQTVDASESAYRAGAVDFLSVIDNWRRLLNFELMERRAVSELEQAWAELRAAVGRDLTLVADEGTPGVRPRQSTDEATTGAGAAAESDAAAREDQR